MLIGKYNTVIGEFNCNCYFDGTEFTDFIIIFLPENKEINPNIPIYCDNNGMEFYVPSENDIINQIILENN